MDDVPTKKLEVTVLSKLNFLGLLSTKEERNFVIEDIVKSVESDEAELNQLLNESESLDIDEPYQDIFKYQLMTLKYGIASHKMDRKWFEAIIGQ